MLQALPAPSMDSSHYSGELLLLLNRSYSIANYFHRIGVGLLLIQISANNWRTYGSIFGGNEIVHLMLSRDVLVLGLTDGIMCASTVVCLLLQKVIAHGYLSWDRTGWILQNVCLHSRICSSY